MARSTGQVANDAWEALLVAHAALIRQFDRPGAWSQVSMREYDVLYTLSKCDGPLRLSELNEHVLLSQPALSRMVERLTGRGLLHREPDPSDRRSVLISLTEAGRATQRQAGLRHAREVAQAVSTRLTPAEAEQLEALCTKLAARSDPPRTEHA